MVDVETPWGPADLPVVYHESFCYYCKSLSDGAIGMPRHRDWRTADQVAMKPV